MQINAYCLGWHVTKSDAFRDILVDPLSPFANIRLTVWGGKQLPNKASKTQDKPIIFCMLPPPADILHNPYLKIVWIPMWDQAQSYDEKWWGSLPKNVYVVAFSDVIYQKSVRAGLKTLKLKYYKNPNDFRPVSWKNGNIVFYWNRTGLIDQDFLEKLCTAVDAKKLLFRSQVDPRIDKKFYYKLPRKLNETEVVNVMADSREDYLKMIEPANIFISPRAREGAGMTFLEAMARGCAVIANNEPTMNEYIIQNKNSLLLDYSGDERISKIIRHIGRSKAKAKAPIHQLSHESQNWHKLAKINFRKLGDNARQDSQKGYDEWIESIPGYAEFVLNW